MNEEFDIGRGACSETYSGNMFSFTDPGPEDIDIGDIAHALAHQCRYGGHSKRFYSVAEHCVLLSRWCHGVGYPAEDVRTALLHDAAEAYVLDLPRPLKACVPGYKQIEEYVEKTVNATLEIPYPKPAWLKTLDLRMIVDERRQAMSRSGNAWDVDGMAPLGVNLRFMSPERAKDAFMLDLQSIELELKQEGKR